MLDKSSLSQRYALNNMQRKFDAESFCRSVELRSARAERNIFIPILLFLASIREDTLMPSPTRRTLLKSAAVISGAAVLPKAAKARVEEAVSRSCPTCGANLGAGDLHRPGCEAARVAAPADNEIKPEKMKLAGKAQAQEPSGCGSRGYDLKSKKPNKGEPGCEARGYDTKSKKQRNR